MSKSTNFKFGTLALREGPVMTLENFCENGAWLGSRDPLNFSALNANTSKMSKSINFKFGTLAPTESPVMTPEKFQKGVWPGSCDPLNFWALNANSSKMTRGANCGMHAPR